MHRRRFLTAVGAMGFAGCARPDGEPAASTSPVVTAPTPSPGRTMVRTATSSSTPSPAVAGPLKGVSLSPQSFESADFTRFLEHATVAGSALRWAGDWTELADREGSPTLVTTLAREHDLLPVIETGVFSASRRQLHRPLTGERIANYVETASSFAAEHAPPYLGLGVEVNLHAEVDPASFEDYVTLFREASAGVADAAPDTDILVTFQYERLRGFRGGLFGGENDPDSAAWELLDRFPGADIVGLTTYPGLIFRDPEAVPDDYFDPIETRVDRPLAITETGWPATTVADGWESSETEQAAFVRRLFELVGGLDLTLLLWLWLYDQEPPSPAFEGMGLRRTEGGPRDAWEAWVTGSS